MQLKPGRDSLYLNMAPCTTVQEIGSKKANIRTQGQQIGELQLS